MTAGRQKFRRVEGGGKEMKKALNKVGQSTLEYVIVLTAIIAAILFAAAQFIKPAVNQIFNEAGNRMNASGQLISNMVGGGVTLGSGTTGGGGTTAGGTTAGGTGGWTP